MGNGSHGCSVAGGGTDGQNGSLLIIDQIMCGSIHARAKQNYRGMTMFSKEHVIEAVKGLGVFVACAGGLYALLMTVTLAVHAAGVM